MLIRSELGLSFIDFCSAIFGSNVQNSNSPLDVDVQMLGANAGIYPIFGWKAISHSFVSALSEVICYENPTYSFTYYPF